jgi:hypothetical protein
MEKEEKSLQILKYVDIAAVFSLIGFGYALSLSIA